jgi:hypothetical protein
MRRPPREEQVGEDQGMDNLVEVVETLASADERDDGEITVRSIFDTVGRRSFGPLLLVPGLIVLSPISGIPGIPTLGGIAVLLIAGQMLIGRETVWLPDFILDRTVTREKMDKAKGFLLPIARVVDRLTGRRLPFLTTPPWAYVIAATCVLIAVLMPPLEAILFANVVTAAAISAFGLALVADDGVLAIVAFILTAVGISLGVYGLFLS